jgi:POT family proton-dependent oligopeptide transporter
MSLVARAENDVLGHPRGLFYLAGTEGWERFSFYGMQALLLLYMTKYLLLPSVAPQVVGLDTFRLLLGNVVGPMTDLAFANQTFGLYAGLMLAAPLLGSWLGDRVLGRTRTVTVGALLMSAGHLTMASERSFLLALLLLILGGGCLVGNLQAQIGGLYPPGDMRRTRAFGVYLMAVNIGAMGAPLVVGTLGEKVAWHWGFGAAGLGMLVGLITYLAGRPHFPPDPVAARAVREPLTRDQWTSIGALLLLLLPKLFAFAACQQAYGIMIIWADTAVDRTMFGWQMPVTWVLTADGALTILGVMVASWTWRSLGARGAEPSDVRKIGIGNMMLVASFLLVSLIAAMARVPLLVWLGFYVVIGFSYAWWDPPMRSLLSRYSPASVTGTMFAVSSLAAALGYFLLGYMGRFYEPLGPSLYFLLVAALPLAGAVMTIMFARPITRLLEAGGRSAPPLGPIVAVPA